jgi:hypothetical protein
MTSAASGMSGGATRDALRGESEEPAPVRAPTSQEVREWRAEFDAAARRPLKTRFKYAFIRTYKPVLDDAPFRAFDTTADYRAWCEANLPNWLGYGRAV